MTSGNHGPPGSPVLDRSERAARTSALLRLAEPSTEASRTALLLEIAALNVDVAARIATAMTARLREDAFDQEGLLDHVRAAYVEAVLRLEPPIPDDFVAQIAAPVRDAVRAYLRARPALVLHHN